MPSTSSGARVQGPSVAADAMMRAGGDRGRGDSIPPVLARVLGKRPPLVPASHERHGVNMAGEWPLQTSLELGALPGAVPCARLHAKQVLWEWALSGLSESVELLVSELLTNAVHASRSITSPPIVRLWLLSDRTRVLILVWDANPKPPTRLEITENAEQGRGLLLIDNISDRWDWYVPLSGGGKVVWSLCGS